MLTVNVSLEERRCKYCGDKFKVMLTSPQQTCSRFCQDDRENKRRRYGDYYRKGKRRDS